MTITVPHTFEIAVGRDDAYADFCLWPYALATQPAPDAVQGVSLLFAAANIGNCVPEHQAMVAALRQGLGPFRTVYGVKWNGHALGCELYFYDYERIDRTVPFRRTASLLSPHVTVANVVDETVPYFMASVEIPMQRNEFPRALDAVDIYIGNPGSSVSSGICYRADTNGSELKNFYFFFDRRRDWDEIVRKAATSAQVPLPRFDIQAILPRWLTDCRIVVVANKRACDAVYFSGISIDQLIRFLAEFGYPPALVAYAKEARSRLAHLQFDVGFDYRIEPRGLRVLKSGFYNVY
jgi:hypothetical protein